MKLPPEGAIWLIRLRWFVATCVFAATLVGYYIFHVLATPIPLFVMGAFMCVYNGVLTMVVREESPIRGLRPEDSIFAQIILDFAALTLVLYFSDFSHNPFILYYIFHMIIAEPYDTESIIAYDSFGNIVDFKII